MASDTIETLNDLVEISKDGEYGFGSAAEYAKGSDLKQLFTRRAEQCRQSAAELQAIVVRLGGTAEDGGTVGGAVHRGWIAVKSGLSGYTDQALLEESERGEDSALESYRDALDTSLPADVRAVVERQYEGVKLNHAQIRTLRDQARAASH